MYKSFKQELQITGGSLLRCNCSPRVAEGPGQGDLEGGKTRRRPAFRVLIIIRRVETEWEITEDMELSWS